MFEDRGRETLSVSRLVRRAESTVSVLAFLSPMPSLCVVFGLMSHARPAAFDDAGGGPVLLPLKSRAVFVGFFPSLVLSVVSIRPFLSGLGVREE